MLKIHLYFHCQRGKQSLLNRFALLPKNWLTRTAPPVACLAASRLLVTWGLTSEGVSSGVMCSRNLAAPLLMALPVASAPLANPTLNRVAPTDMNMFLGW